MDGWMRRDGMTRDGMGYYRMDGGSEGWIDGCICMCHCNCRDGCMDGWMPVPARMGDILFSPCRIERRTDACRVFVDVCKDDVTTVNIRYHMKDCMHTFMMHNTSR